MTPQNERRLMSYNARLNELEAQVAQLARELADANTKLAQVESKVETLAVIPVKHHSHWWGGRGMMRP